MKSILVTTLAVLAAGLPTDKPDSSNAVAGKTSVSMQSTSTSRMVLKCHSRSKQLLGNDGGVSQGGVGQGGVGQGRVSQAKTPSTEAVFKAQPHPVPRTKVEADLTTLSQAAIVIVGNKFQFKQAQQVCIAVRLVLEPRVTAETGAVDIHSYLEPCQPAEAYSVVTKMSDTYYQGPIIHTEASTSTSGAIEVVFDNVTPRRAVLGRSSKTEVQTVTYESHLTSRFVIECTSITQYASRQQLEYDESDSRCNKMLTMSVEYSSTSQFLVKTVSHFVDCPNKQLCHGTQACNQDKCIFWSQHDVAAPPVAIDSVRTVPTDIVGAVNNATQGNGGNTMVVQDVPGKDSPKVQPPAGPQSSTTVPSKQPETSVASSPSTRASSTHPSFRLVPSVHPTHSYKQVNSSAATSTVLKTQTTSLASVPTQKPVNSTTSLKAHTQDSNTMEPVVNATTSLKSVTTSVSSTSRMSKTSTVMLTSQPRPSTTSMASTTKPTVSTSAISSTSTSSSTCAPKTDEEIEKDLHAWKKEHPGLKSQVESLIIEIGVTEFSLDALKLDKDAEVKSFFRDVDTFLQRLGQEDGKVKNLFHSVLYSLRLNLSSFSSIYHHLRRYFNDSNSKQLVDRFSTGLTNALSIIKSGAGSRLETWQKGKTGEKSLEGGQMAQNLNIFLDVAYNTLGLANPKASHIKSTHEEAEAVSSKVKSILDCDGDFNLFMKKIDVVIFQFKH